MAIPPTLQRSCLLLLLLPFIASSGATSGIFNVKDYGAVSDENKDSAQAFLSAWKDACAAGGSPRLVVSAGTYLVSPVVFEGPCKSPIVFQMAGAVVAPTDLGVFSSDAWIEFRKVNGLILTGGGKFDGRGGAVWPQNQCKHSSSCKLLPTSLKFDGVTNATVRTITSVDSKSFHMVVHGCQDINLHSLTISAPADSPNTDGIHIGNSNGVNIGRSAIGTGDDCISVGPGSTGVTVTSVRCGPGHGISIGSLGKYHDEKDVVGVRVRNCTFSGTTNGVRIKTWPNSEASAASDMIFEKLLMDHVSNPIIINQNYCPSSSCGQQSNSQVKLSNIKFADIRGTSKSKVAMQFLCSQAVPCHDVQLGDIHLSFQGDEEATASCTNVNGFTLGTVIPPACL